jgi:hypothetical protein
VKTPKSSSKFLKTLVTTSEKSESFQKNLEIRILSEKILATPDIPSKYLKILKNF